MAENSKRKIISGSGVLEANVGQRVQICFSKDLPFGSPNEDPLAENFLKMFGLQPQL